MKAIATLFVVIGFTLGTLTVASSDAEAFEAPDVLIKRVSQEVMATARSDKDIQAGNRRRIFALVETKILPHLDFQRATALTVGRYWRSATPAQQQRLADEFRTLLLYTYSGAMSLVRDQQLEFAPLRADPADTEVEVHSRVRLPRRAEPVQVNYRLFKSPSGWKIYDVNVLGVWVSETYKSSFASIINKGGIDGLIRTLSEKNRKLAASASVSAKAP